MQKVNVTLEFNSVQEAQEALSKLGAHTTATVSATGSAKVEKEVEEPLDLTITSRTTVAQLEAIAAHRGIDVSGLKKAEMIDKLEGREPVQENVAQAEVVVEQPVNTAPSFDREGCLADIKGRIMQSFGELGLSPQDVGGVFQDVYSQLGIQPVKVDGLTDANLSNVHAKLDGKIQELKAQQTQQGHSPAGPSFI